MTTTKGEPMTEQERPRTREGQALIRDLMAWEPGAVESYRLESYRLEARILAIEAEGRQQADAVLLEIAGRMDAWEGAVRAAGVWKDTDPDARMCVWVRNTARAGLNASESPQTGCTCGADYGSASCPVHDASEPHRDYAGRTCTTGLMHSHGDASESPPPPER